MSVVIVDPKVACNKKSGAENKTNIFTIHFVLFQKKGVRENPPHRDGRDGIFPNDER